MQCSLQTSKMLSSCLTEHPLTRWKSLTASAVTWSGLWARILPSLRSCMSLENPRLKVGCVHIPPLLAGSWGELIMLSLLFLCGELNAFIVLSRHADQNARLWAVSANTPTHLQGQRPRDLWGLRGGPQGVWQGGEWHGHGSWAQACSGNPGWVEHVHCELNLWCCCCNNQYLTWFLDRRWEDEWGRGGAADAKPGGC